MMHLLEKTSIFILLAPTCYLQLTGTVRSRGSYMILMYYHTVSHFSYAPSFQGPLFLTKMLESNILFDYLLIDMLSVL